MVSFFSLTTWKNSSKIFQLASQWKSIKHERNPQLHNTIKSEDRPKNDVLIYIIVFVHNGHIGWHDHSHLSRSQFRAFICSLCRYTHGVSCSISWTIFFKYHFKSSVIPTQNPLCSPHFLCWHPAAPPALPPQLFPAVVRLIQTSAALPAAAVSISWKAGVQAETGGDGWMRCPYTLLNILDFRRIATAKTAELWCHGKVCKRSTEMESSWGSKLIFSHDDNSNPQI